MSLYLLLFLLVGSAGVLASFVIWPKINYAWLPQLCRWLVISLPFERIPSLNTPIGNIRISQILVLVGFWFLVLLLLKKDKVLAQTKLNAHSIYIFLFLFFSLPSWLQVINFNRFLSTFIATLLVFGAYFLLSHFTENIYARIQELVFTMIFVGFFGVYQFVGDMIGLPFWLTGLRETYTKIVFGIPRIHATAIEPLYFASLLFLPIFACFTFIVARRSILKKSYKYSNFVLLLFFITLFILTLSKGAWIAIAIIFPLFLFFIAQKFKILELIKSLGSWLFNIVILFGFSLFYSEAIFSFAIGFWQHLVSTFTFNTATSVERLTFVNSAWQILQQYFITGIGSGQYGVYAEKLIGVATTPGSFLIVNNVYLEVWLEFGLVSSCLFLLFIFTPVIRSLIQMGKTRQISDENQIAQFILTFSLLAYYIQWTLFSPVFIMPIFILLGLLCRLTNFANTAKIVDES